MSPAPSPPAASTAGVSSSDAAEPSRIALATSSLEARRYRDALTYAQEVLRVAPENREAQRVRDEASRVIARFDDAIARSQRSIASNDLVGAAEALRVARDIDPNASIVANLSEQIADQSKARASARSKPEPPVPTSAPTQAPSSGPRVPERGAGSQPTVPPPVVSANPPPQLPPPAVTPVSPEPPPPASRQASPPPERTVSAASTPAEPRPSDAPPPEPVKPVEPAAPPRATPPPPADAAAQRPPETDEALIARLIENWARAIETKDLAAYRAVKPNMTASEARRIEEGFRTVASQRVVVTILGIELRGQQALVRLRRRDTIAVGGREQIQDSQQALTVVRAGANWVIRDIGR
jgi:hypothetical protein